MLAPLCPPLFPHLPLIPCLTLRTGSWSLTTERTNTATAIHTHAGGATPRSANKPRSRRLHRQPSSSRGASPSASPVGAPAPAFATPAAPQGPSGPLPSQTPVVGAPARGADTSASACSQAGGSPMAWSPQPPLDSNPLPTAADSAAGSRAAPAPAPLSEPPAQLHHPMGPPFPQPRRLCLEGAARHPQSRSAAAPHCTVVSQARTGCPDSPVASRLELPALWVLGQHPPQPTQPQRLAWEGAYLE